MKLIVGIGNPGKKYQFTRHNAGFMILDYFADKKNLSFKPSKYDFYQTGGTLGSVPFFLIKPTTYVNNSGLAILDFLSEHPTETENILIVHDELNLPTGKIKIKQSGSSGGHNGLESAIYHLQKDNFARLRFGIGNEFEKGEMANYVLDTFSREDTPIIESGFETALNLIENFIFGGYKGMADYFSRHRLEEKRDKTPPEKESL